MVHKVVNKPMNVSPHLVHDWETRAWSNCAKNGTTYFQYIKKYIYMYICISLYVYELSAFFRHLMLTTFLVFTHHIFPSTTFGEGIHQTFSTLFTFGPCFRPSHFVVVYSETCALDLLPVTYTRG